MTRVVLAYSGGVDTSVAIPWLIEQHQAEVVTVTLDLGQGIELEEVRDRALASGAVRAHVIDARDLFARDFIQPALQARAIYEDRYPLATALGRPLVARQLVLIAGIEAATAVAHGAGRG
jgi:argininosuccinate synthase